VAAYEAYVRIDERVKTHFIDVITREFTDLATQKVKTELAMSKESLTFS
jgi:hypothetical protein